MEVCGVKNARRKYLRRIPHSHPRQCNAVSYTGQRWRTEMEHKIMVARRELLDHRNNFSVYLIIKIAASIYIPITIFAPIYLRSLKETVLHFSRSTSNYSTNLFSREAVVSENLNDRILSVTEECSFNFPWKRRRAMRSIFIALCCVDRPNIHHTCFKSIVICIINTWKPRWRISADFKIMTIF